MKFNRLIATRYMTATNARGARYKCSMAGHKANTYGAGVFRDGRDEAEQAAEMYFDSLYTDAHCVMIKRIANPIANSQEQLFLVTYMGIR